MTDAPKKWRDLTDFQKVSLLLAAHDGEAVERFNAGEWIAQATCWNDDTAYRIAPTAEATPKLWRNMTDAEKGALLLAAHRGEEVQFYSNTKAYTWQAVPYDKPGWFDASAYRVKPKAPKVETVTDQRHVWEYEGGHIQVGEEHATTSQCLGNITHTYTITDGIVTACDTIIHPAN